MSTFHWRVVLLSIVALCVAGGGCRSWRAGRAGDRKSATATTATTTQEFRGIFVATAYNLDWPYKRNLHQTEMRRQMEVVIARAKEVKANVILLQVRAFGDRIYDRTNVTPTIPWAASLNGGFDPDGGETEHYDPLREWIDACHNEGLQIHAWFNPFRVDTLVQEHHEAGEANDRFYEVIHTPDGKHLYLDARKPSVQKYVLGVLDDLLTHYGATEPPAPAMKQTMRSPSGV